METRFRKAAAHDPAVRCLVIRGGEHFMAGGDLKWFLELLVRWDSFADGLRHRPDRIGHAGCVELWPMLEAAETEPPKAAIWNQICSDGSSK